MGFGKYGEMPRGVWLKIIPVQTNNLTMVATPRIIVTTAIALRNDFPSDFFIMNAATGAEAATPTESERVRSQFTADP